MAKWPFLFNHPPIQDVHLFQPELEIPPWDEAYAHLPIGKVMEHRFKDALIASERYELLRHGLQIQGDSRTLGELDFLIRDSENEQVWHIEFVYKFYIHRQELGSGPFDPWIGPGLKDRLTYKLDKLSRQQFPILFSKESALLLDEIGLAAGRIQQGLAFCAELYLPQGMNEIHTTLDTRCIRGHWYDTGSFPESYSTLARKMDWIRPMESKPKGEEMQSLNDNLKAKGHVMIREASGRKAFVLAKQE